MTQATSLYPLPTVFGTHTGKNLPGGWCFLDTPGHGYLYPSAEANERVPSSLRESNYEEDVAFVIPIIFNSELFTKETVEACLASFKNWMWSDYERLFGVELKRGESSLKDREVFDLRDNVGKYLVTAAFGDWAFDVPSGCVYVEAVPIKPLMNEAALRAQPRETFLISSEAYRSRHNSILEPGELTAYKRDETYYTWDEYPGKRYKQTCFNHDANV